MDELINGDTCSNMNRARNKVLISCTPGINKLNLFGNIWINYKKIALFSGTFLAVLFRIVSVWIWKEIRISHREGCQLKSVYYFYIATYSSSNASSFLRFKSVTDIAWHKITQTEWKRPVIHYSKPK